MSKEIESTGIGGDELTEFELLMEELIALSQESNQKAESETGTAKKNASTDQEQAMETMAQSKKRQAEAADDDKKGRRSGFDTISWLAEKTKWDAHVPETARTLQLAFCVLACVFVVRLVKIVSSHCCQF